jgi:hypothetical protein
MNEATRAPARETCKKNRLGISKGITKWEEAKVDGAARRSMQRFEYLLNVMVVVAAAESLLKGFWEGKNKENERRVIGTDLLVGHGPSLAPLDPTPGR